MIEVGQEGRLLGDWQMSNCVHKHCFPWKPHGRIQRRLFNVAVTTCIPERENKTSWLGTWTAESRFGYHVNSASAIVPVVT